MKELNIISVLSVNEVGMPETSIEVFTLIDLLPVDVEHVVSSGLYDGLHFKKISGMQGPAPTTIRYGSCAFSLICLKNEVEIKNSIFGLIYKGLGQLNEIGYHSAGIRLGKRLWEHREIVTERLLYALRSFRTDHKDPFSVKQLYLLVPPEEKGYLTEKLSDYLKEEVLI